jgi:kumamolisin
MLATQQFPFLHLARDDQMKSMRIRLPSSFRFSLRAAALLSAMVLPGIASAALPMSVPSDARLPHPAATLVGRTAASRILTLSFALPSRDPKGAAEFATRVGKVGDPLYRQYLTPSEYAARFGASQADYDALVAWARTHGLTPGEAFTARTILPLSGRADAFEAALGVKFSDYAKASGEKFYEADSTAKLPAELAGKVSGVLGLSSYNHFRSLARGLPAGTHPLESGTGPGAAFAAADLRAAYSIPAQAYANKPQQLGIFEQGGFYPSDISTYLAKMKLPNVKLEVRGVDGYGGGVDDPGVELEAVLDIDMQIAINPAAQKITIYEDGSDTFQVALVDSFSAMATDHSVKSISVSYGQDEALQGATAIAAENTVLTQLAAQGQAVFVSSGDDGAYGDEPPALNVSDPASQPFVTAVGGTTLFTGPKEVYYAEETWNDLGAGDGATGGGISSVWAMPSYQVQFGTAVATANGGSATYRNVPDVAAVGNPLTGVAVYSAINGGWITIGGTSVSAPIWAGFYSLANAESEGLGFGALGFANPAIYTVGTSFGYFYPDLYDIYDGSNGDATIYGVAGFNAGPGYDNTTGYGSFNGTNLALELALLPTRANTSPPSAPTHVEAVPAAKSIVVSWKKAPGDIAYLVVGYNYQTFASLPTQLLTATTVTISGLAPSTYYYFEIVGVSKGGTNAAAPIILQTLK